MPTLEKGIVELLQKGHRVYLTGNPGDGKTHLLRQLQGRADWPANTWVEPDASAVAPAELLVRIAGTPPDGAALLAINEGPLRQLIAQLPAPDGPELRAQLAQPFRYEAAPEAGAVPKAVLVQLGTRQVLTDEIMSGALAVVLRRVDYAGAPPAVEANRQALEHERVRDRLLDLLRYVRRSGTHVTVHQVLGLLARMLTGGYLATPEAAPPYYESLFAAPAESSPLAAELAHLDPATLPHAIFDTVRLWDAPTTAGPWLPDRTPSPAAPASDPDPAAALALFQGLKRRHYFEAEPGAALLQAALPDDQATFGKLLTDPPRVAVAPILRALIRFGGQTDTRDLRLPLWTALRYDPDRAPTARVAGSWLGEADLLVQRPALDGPAADLLDYRPDHVRLTLASQPGPNGPALRVDLPLWRVLRAVGRGRPAGQHEEAARRVLNFLAAAAATIAPGEYLQVYDTEKSQATTVRVVADPEVPSGWRYAFV